MASKSVYIHIPFCKSICTYCDFCKLLYDKKWISSYLNALKNEIDAYYQGEDISTIYIGGGTPSMLSYDELTKLFDIIKVFNVLPNAEITIEANVNDINTQFISLIMKNKVNRLSIGVQSFNKAKCLYLGRNHTYENVKNAIKVLNDNKFINYNIDLIYAVENESMLLLVSDIKKVVSLNPTHISTYSLIIEDNTILKTKNAKNVDEKVEVKMYKYICKYLSKHGYKHYEVSNFAKIGYESVHNKVYWHNNEYYGFGLGACGYLDNVRYQNTKNINKYIEGKYRLEELILSKKDEMDNEVMLGLRLIDGLDLKEFYSKFHYNIQEVYDLDYLLKENLLVLNGNMLKINENKIYVMNEILNKIIK